MTMKSLSRRQWMCGALLGAAGPGAAKSQQSCGTPVPANAFGGTIGKTAQDSKASPLKVPTAPAHSPNIIYIVPDHTGFSDLHCFGSEVSTPNVDVLAAGGLRYTNFRSKAIFSPTRAALLAG